MAQRAYALFWTVRTPGARTRYERATLSSGRPFPALPKDQAVRRYQDLLISTAFSGRPLELRPVKEDIA